jgi:hypothetical protein
MGDFVGHFLTAWTSTLYNISILEYESVVKIESNHHTIV